MLATRPTPAPDLTYVIGLPTAFLIASALVSIVIFILWGKFKQT